jgi:hypothetical protein
MATSEELKKSVEDALGMDFEVTQRLCPSELKKIIEERNASPCRLAVPFYDSKTEKWTYDPNHFSNPEEALNKALRVPWYERILDFFHR